MITDDPQEPPEPTPEEREIIWMRDALIQMQVRLSAKDKAAGLTLDWQIYPECGHQYVRFEQGEITLERLPWSVSDRGWWRANVWPKEGSLLFLSLDGADGFPRYYFDETRAKLEMEAWAKKRGLL